jgi:hypothetical protein
MLAQGNVTINSPNLSGAVSELSVWFDQTASRGNGDPSTSRPLIPVSGYRGAGQAVELAQHVTAGRRVIERRPGDAAAILQPGSIRSIRSSEAERSPLEPIRLPAPAPVHPVSAAAGGGLPLSAVASAAKVHLEITGRSLWAGLAMRNNTPELSKLRIEGDVELQATETANPGERPLVIRGEEIHVVNALQPNASATVKGRQTYVDWRGLRVTGTNINLNRGANRLWIDGPGQMQLPLDRDFADRPLDEPLPLKVEWKRQMEFDGRTVKFEQSVVASTPHQRVETETLELELKEPIRFDQPPNGRDPEPRELRCGGQVWMTSQSFDQLGLASREQVQVGNLAINLITGKTTAAGPGWMTRTGKGSDGPSGLPFGSGTDQPPGHQDPGQDKLSYLEVRFQRGIEGNVHHRKLIFDNQVRCAYGPVDSWDAKLDPNDPDSLPADGVLMSCDRLAVTQMPVPTTDEFSVELEATGNTLVEGRQFTARAVRMTFDEAKDLLILEGDGRVNAELYYEPYLGGPRSNAAAQKIQYSPSRNQLQVFGSPSFELNQGPGEGR